jgi:hypothetical protein
MHINQSNHRDMLRLHSHQFAFLKRIIYLLYREIKDDCLVDVRRYQAWYVIDNQWQASGKSCMLCAYFRCPMEDMLAGAHSSFGMVLVLTHDGYISRECSSCLCRGAEKTHNSCLIIVMETAAEWLRQYSPGPSCGKQGL